jgi:octaprenyl-diphosphate synthase
LGALSVGASQEEQKQLKSFGEYLGIAFQIKDDLFDYEKQGSIGKPTGNDIKEKKLTLPLIYVLRNISGKEKKWVLNIIRKHNKNSEKVLELIQFVKDKGGIDYTRNKMLEFKEKAKNILSYFPESEANNSLRDLVEYTISRNK